MTARPHVRAAERLAQALVMVGLAGVLLVVLELGARVVLRLVDGSWPRTEVVAAWNAGRALHGLSRDHAFLNTAPRAAGSVAVGGKRARVNTLGYRSPERDPAPLPAGPRIVTSGGSTTFDSLSPSDEETWPWRLEERLGALGVGAEVWNGGFPGWTSAENLIALALRDVDLEPDLVVLLQGFNDLQPGSHRPFDPTYHDGHGLTSRLALGVEPWTPSLLERSVLLERLGRRGRPPRTEPPLERLPAAAVATFRRNVESFVAVARRHGAEVLLVTQPLRPAPATGEAAGSRADCGFVAGWIPGLACHAVPVELGRLDEVLREVAATGRADLADAARAVDWVRADFGDPVHFSRAGAERLAGFLAAEIAARWAERGPRGDGSVEPRPPA